MYIVGKPRQYPTLHVLLGQGSTSINQRLFFKVLEKFDKFFFSNGPGSRETSKLERMHIAELYRLENCDYSTELILEMGWW